MGVPAERAVTNFDYNYSFAPQFRVLKQLGYPKRVGPTAWAVFDIILHYTDKELRFPNGPPRFSDITDMLGINRNTLSRALETLQKHNLIGGLEKGRGTRTTMYHLTMDIDHFQSSSCPVPGWIMRKYYTDCARVLIPKGVIEDKQESQRHNFVRPTPQFVATTYTNTLIIIPEKGEDMENTAIGDSFRSKVLEFPDEGIIHHAIKWDDTTIHLCESFFYSVDGLKRILDSAELCNASVAHVRDSILFMQMKQKNNLTYLEKVVRTRSEKKYKPNPQDISNRLVEYFDPMGVKFGYRPVTNSIVLREEQRYNLHPELEKVIIEDMRRQFGITIQVAEK